LWRASGRGGGLAAIRRRKTVSAVAAEILDRNLPKLRIERDV
jgi:hypothetical protein